MEEIFIKTTASDYDEVAKVLNHELGWDGDVAWTGEGVERALKGNQQYLEDVDGGYIVRFL